MEKLTTSSKIYLAPSAITEAGRGVFAAQPIKKGEVIEECPVIVVQEKDAATLKETELRNYYFMWGEGLRLVAIALGFGSLYNHSYEPNATYMKKPEEKMINFVAIKDIITDEEITVNYNFGNPDDKSKLWIEGIPPAES